MLELVRKMAKLKRAKNESESLPDLSLLTSIYRVGDAVTV